MFLLTIRWIVLWLGCQLAFVVIGAVISIATMALAARQTRTSDLEGLGGWVMPMLLFWALCILAAAVFIARDHSLLGLANALAIFLPGALLGSASVFMAGPLWSSRREGD
ncbi:MAG: hypothetical protein ACOYYS_17170 [Chloroflexota bacterium]